MEARRGGPHPRRAKPRQASEQPVQLSWRMSQDDHAVLAAEAFLRGRDTSVTDLARDHVSSLVEELRKKPDVVALLDRRRARGGGSQT